MKPFFTQLNAAMPEPKSFTEIHRAMLQLKADAQAYQAANRNPLADGYSDAIAGLCDTLADASGEFENEIPKSGNPGEHYRPGGHGSV